MGLTWYIVVALAILVSVYYKKIRGFMGEFWVKLELLSLPKDKYKVLNDIMIENNGTTYQIDHIVISKKGIFVIEMKNYFGLIVGDEYKDKWIQYLGKNKYYFNNPIHQNYGHIKALQEVLHIKENKFISVICISNQAKLKVRPKNVVQVDGLIDLIMSYKENVIENNIENITEILILKNITDKSKRKEHVNKIKSKIKSNVEKEKNMICPKCGGNLVERNGKYGKFIGCSNYPRCNFTKK